MKTRNKVNTLFLTQAACVAALYVLLTLLSNALGLASQMIQLRLSEVLCWLPILMPAAIPGLAVGCFLANLLTGAVWLDVIFGSLATLLGALGTYWLRRRRWLSSLPPVLANALIVPFVLAYGYGAEDAIWLMMLTVGAGEILSVCLLGGFLFHFLAPALTKIKS